MIKTKTDLYYYLSQDRKALGLKTHQGVNNLLNCLFSPNLIWIFEKTLRHVEYYTNIDNSTVILRYWRRFICLLYRRKLRRLSLKLGFTIPINVFGPGLSIAHIGTIVVNGNASVGANCRLHCCVNIGASGGSGEAPHIGNNVYIGPGAIIFGNITIANDVTIGANATVNRSCEKERVVLAGTPAAIVKENTNNWLEFNKTEI